MIINHPLLGPRDSEEFVYLGSTDLINRPTNWEEDASAEDFYQYQYIRENVAGDHKELWYHEPGDQSWLVITQGIRKHTRLRILILLKTSQGQWVEENESD